MSDFGALKDMAAHLRSQPQKKVEEVPLGELPDYATVILAALDDALIMIGRSGTQVFHDTMKQVYGYDRIDVAEKPGEYMSALKALLDSSSDMIEGYILREVYKTRNIRAGSIQDAIHMLKTAGRSEDPPSQ